MEKAEVLGTRQARTCKGMHERMRWGGGREGIIKLERETEGRGWCLFVEEDKMMPAWKLSCETPSCNPSIPLINPPIPLWCFHTAYIYSLLDILFKQLCIPASYSQATQKRGIYRTYVKHIDALRKNTPDLNKKLRKDMQRREKACTYFIIVLIPCWRSMYHRIMDADPPIAKYNKINLFYSACLSN